jgi:hypothetical protein
VTVWLNAFLPRDIFGLTAVLADGEYRGCTAIRTPPRYLTDQRSYSAHMGARSRMHSMATLDFAGREPALLQSHRCDPLVECDGDGAVLRRLSGSTAAMRFSLIAAAPAVMLRMECRFMPVGAAPWYRLDQIEYKGTIAIDRDTGSVAIDAMIGFFPAFEAYAVIDGGSPLPFFRHAPPPGILNIRTAPGATRRLRTRLAQVIPSGDE